MPRAAGSASKCLGLWPCIGLCGYHSYMPVSLPLSEMTLEEKLQAMEALWDDLSRDPDTLESPAWHEDVLRERDEQVAAGEAEFVDWEEAKADIRSRAHED